MDREDLDRVLELVDQLRNIGLLSRCNDDVCEAVIASMLDDETRDLGAFLAAYQWEIEDGLAPDGVIARALDSYLTEPLPRLFYELNRAAGSEVLRLEPWDDELRDLADDNDEKWASIVSRPRLELRFTRPRTNEMEEMSIAVDYAELVGLFNTELAALGEARRFERIDDGLREARLYGFMTKSDLATLDI